MLCSAVYCIVLYCFVLTLFWCDMLLLEISFFSLDNLQKWFLVSAPSLVILDLTVYFSSVLFSSLHITSSVYPTHITHLIPFPFPSLFSSFSSTSSFHSLIVLFFFFHFFPHDIQLMFFSRTPSLRTTRCI